MKIYILIGLLILSSCSSQKKQINGAVILSEEIDEEIALEMSHYPTLTVTKIENRKDGYTAHLIDGGKMTYTMIVSIPNLKGNYIDLKIGDRVKVNGDYAESIPVQIYAKKIILLKVLNH